MDLSFIKGSPAEGEHSDVAGMRSALAHAIESAMVYSADMPVGAVAITNGEIVGYGTANDQRKGDPLLHAEVEAVQDALYGDVPRRPDTIVTTLEPCGQCQDYLAGIGGLRRVVFGLPRSEASDRGLVAARPISAAERAKSRGYSFEVVHMDNPSLSTIGKAVLDSVLSRDFETGAVTIDRALLFRSLVTLYENGHQL